MLTFAMTTTTKLAGLSLYEKDKLLGEIHVEMAKTHSTTILEQIDSLLKWTGKKLDEIENVLVSIGPGSFTGVRIAISVVKGLFFGRSVNFYEVNELDALGFQVYYNLKVNLENDEDVKIYSLIDSRKEKVYYAVYEILQKKGNFENENGKNKLKLEMVKSYEVSKLDKIIEEIIENSLSMYINAKDFYEENIFTETVDRDHGSGGTKYYLDKNYEIKKGKREFKKVPVIYSTRVQAEESSENVKADFYNGEAILVNFI